METDKKQKITGNPRLNPYVIQDNSSLFQTNSSENVGTNTSYQNQKKKKLPEQMKKYLQTVPKLSNIQSCIKVSICQMTLVTVKKTRPNHLIQLKIVMQTEKKKSSRA